MSDFEITDNAIKEIKSIVQQQGFNAEEIYILLGFKITHSGFSYNFHIIESILENSNIKVFDGIKFVLNEKFEKVFDGVKLDYVFEPSKFGFVFDESNIEILQ